MRDYRYWWFFWPRISSDYRKAARTGVVMSARQSFAQRLHFHEWHKRTLRLPSEECCLAVLEEFAKDDAPVFLLCTIASSAISNSAKQDPSGIALSTLTRLSNVIIQIDVAGKSTSGAPMKALRHILRASSRRLELRQPVFLPVVKHVLTAWVCLFDSNDFHCMQRAQLLKTLDVLLTLLIEQTHLAHEYASLCLSQLESGSEKNLSLLLKLASGQQITKNKVSFVGDTRLDGNRDARKQSHANESTFARVQRQSLQAFLTGNNPKRLFRIAIRVALHATRLRLVVEGRGLKKGDSFSSTDKDQTVDQKGALSSSKRRRLESRQSTAFPCLEKLIQHGDSVVLSIMMMIDDDEDLLLFLGLSLQIWCDVFMVFNSNHFDLNNVGSKHHEGTRRTNDWGCFAQWNPIGVLGSLSQVLGGTCVCVDFIIELFLHPETGVEAIQYCLNLSKVCLRVEVADYESILAKHSSCARAYHDGMHVLSSLHNRILNSQSLMAMGLKPLAKALRNIDNKHKTASAANS